MTTLSLNLPDNLAKASQEAAGKMGISRTEFIRKAIAHELKNFYLQLEEEAIIRSFTAMKTNASYRKEVEMLEEDFGSDLFDEDDDWWNKTS